MDSEHIEKLLERYWNCESTLEEEAQLRAFFARADVPKNLLKYKDLFVYQDVMKETSLGRSFDDKVIASINRKAVKAQRVTIMTRMMPIFKAAAAVLLILGAGNLVQHSLVNDVQNLAVSDTIMESINAPSVALSEEHNVDTLLDNQDSLNITNHVYDNKTKEE